MNHNCPSAFISVMNVKLIKALHSDLLIPGRLRLNVFSSIYFHHFLLDVATKGQECMWMIKGTLSRE
jgi:hypothetical protein